jgi:signal transduction histidine kinase
MDPADLIRLAARGALSGAVTDELAQPLARICDSVGQVVDALDRHVAGARGPEPLSWNAVGDLRQRLADVFLDLGHLRRLALDLALVSSSRSERQPEPADVNELVERALSLARHRLAADQEVYLDLGTLPAVEVDVTRLVQALAHLCLIASEAAGPGGTITVRTGAQVDGSVVLTLTFPGSVSSSTFAGFVAGELALESGGLVFQASGGLTTASMSLRVAK